MHNPSDPYNLNNPMERSQEIQRQNQIAEQQRQEARRRALEIQRQTQIAEQQRQEVRRRALDRKLNAHDEVDVATSHYKKALDLNPKHAGAIERLRASPSVSHTPEPLPGGVGARGEQPTSKPESDIDGNDAQQYGFYTLLKNFFRYLAGVKDQVRQ
jgi:hypothetical protein